MIQDLQLIAMSTAGRWQPTFVHGEYAIRIDFILIRHSQHRVSMHSYMGLQFQMPQAYQAGTSKFFPVARDTAAHHLAVNPE